MTTSTQVRLRARPVGEPADSDFETTTEEVPALEDGQVLLRTVYLSLDPYMRGRMSDAKSYAAPVGLGEVMVGATVCEVLESRSDRRAVGDLVLAYTGWQTHAVADARHTRRLDPAQAPVSTALGVLGMRGFTAYAGLLEIGRPKPGETVVVATHGVTGRTVVAELVGLEQQTAWRVLGGFGNCHWAVVEQGRSGWRITQWNASAEGL